MFSIYSKLLELKGYFGLYFMEGFTVWRGEKNQKPVKITKTEIILC